MFFSLDSNRLSDSGFARLGKLINKADSFDPLPQDLDIIKEKPDGEMYRHIWEEASTLRITGKLLRLGERISCPVVAIHGDYDPHPGEGVKDPLSRVLKKFRFILLEKCGHYPWLESNAKVGFYRVLREEIETQTWDY